jgi:hypothetical protein
MRILVKISSILSALTLLLATSCNSGPEDAFDIICESCKINDGVAIVGACRGDASLKINNGELTVIYAVDCGNGPSSATESGKATELEVVNSPDGSFIKGKWVRNDEFLSDANFKLSFNENWEYHYGKELRLTIYGSNWEYRFNWTTSEGTIEELSKLIYTEKESAEILERRSNRIPLDYEVASEMELLTYILNSKWRNEKGEAKVVFDSITNTLLFDCETSRGNQTYSLGNFSFDNEFHRYMTYRNLKLFQKGFWVDYLVPYYSGQNLANSKGLILEQSGGRLYFDGAGFFYNYGITSNRIDEHVIRYFLKKLKERKAPVKATLSKRNTNSGQLDFYTVEDPDGFSNLRETPSGRVISKVYNGDKFEVIGDEQNYKKVKLTDATIGFIHASRVKSFNSKVCDCITAAKAIVEKDLDKDPEMKTGFSDDLKKANSERIMEIFKFNNCPMGCEFLADETVIDFTAEIQRCL